MNLQAIAFDLADKLESGKIYFRVGQRKFVGHIWETNKGAVRGLCKWELCEYVPDLEQWYTHDGENWPRGYDTCLRELAVAIHNAKGGHYEMPE